MWCARTKPNSDASNNLGGLSVNLRNTIALSLILQGCAMGGKDCQLPEPSSNNASELIVYHARGNDAPITLDGCNIGWLEARTFIRRRVVAGKHTVRSEKRFLAAGGDAEISVDLMPGEATYLRYGTQWAGQFAVQGVAAGFAITDKLSAEAETPSLRQSGPQ